MDILKEVLTEVLHYALAAVLPAVGILIGRLILFWTNKINNTTLRELAIQAVLFAEDKLGPDTNTGKKKLQLAVDFLVEKTKIDRDKAEMLVRAAYQNVFAPFQQKATS